MSAKHGLDYVGVELRAPEVEAVRKRCQKLGVTDSVTIHNADSRNVGHLVADQSADFLLTCPPYYDLETYGGGAADLSMAADYPTFCRMMQDVVAETKRILKPGAFSCWVIGLHRDKNGAILPMHHDICRAHDAVGGFRYKEEIILAHRNNGAIQRVGQFDKGDRRLVRTHEYLQVFVR